MANLFVLVSTGQPVANLPPVLEHAHVGDFVLWVESSEARRRQWTAGARGVLEDRGLVTAGAVEVDQVNDPVSLSAALAPVAEEARGQYERVFLVANGGNKLSPIGLIRGLRPLDPELLYGDDRPAVCRRHAPGLDHPPAVSPYTRHTLDLPEILRASGHLVRNPGEARRIWPDLLPPECRDEPYGRDEAYTYQLHADHQARAAVGSAAERVPFPHVPTLAPERYDRWLRTVRQYRDRPTPAHLAALYNGTLGLDEVARRAVVARVLPRPAAGLGDSFERAVARRVREWLDGTRHPAVQSAWSNVVASREADPHRSTINFDILLVLRNGVLLHLECKSAEVDIRDLDARLHRLQRAGSRVATLAVVLPLFTRCAGEPWFHELRARREEVEQAELTVLPFTWPGQPDRYLTSGPPEQVDCPSFDAALARLLAPYQSREGTARE